MAFFAVPARGDSGLQESLNAFLRSHRVLTVHRHQAIRDQGDHKARSERMNKGGFSWKRATGVTRVKCKISRATGIPLVLLLLLAAALDTSAYESQPDWATRYSELRRAALNEFTPPKIGDRITVVRRIGGKYTGRVNALSPDRIVIGEERLESTQLTPQSARTVFAEEYARTTAMRRLKAEKASYESRNTVHRNYPQETARNYRRPEPKSRPHAAGDLRNRKPFGGVNVEELFDNKQQTLPDLYSSPAGDRRLQAMKTGAALARLNFDQLPSRQVKDLVDLRGRAMKFLRASEQLKRRNAGQKLAEKVSRQNFRSKSKKTLKQIQKIRDANVRNKARAQWQFINDAFDTAVAADPIK